MYNIIIVYKNINTIRGEKNPPYLCVFKSVYDPGIIIIILCKTSAGPGSGAKLNLNKYTFIKTSIKVTYYLCYLLLRNLHLAAFLCF